MIIQETPASDCKICTCLQMYNNVCEYDHVSAICVCFLGSLSLPFLRHITFTNQLILVMQIFAHSDIPSLSIQFSTHSCTYWSQHGKLLICQMIHWTTSNLNNRQVIQLLVVSVNKVNEGGFSEGTLSGERESPHSRKSTLMQSSS